MDSTYTSPIPERAAVADVGSRTRKASPGMSCSASSTTTSSRRSRSSPQRGQHAHRQRVVQGVFEDAYNYMKSGQLLRQVINKINEVDFNNLADRQHFGDVYEQILNDLQSAGNAGEYYTPRAVTTFMTERIDPKPGEIILDPACGTGGFLTCCARAHAERTTSRRPTDEELMQSSLRAVEKKPLPHMLCTTNMLLHGIEDPSFVRHDNTLARPYVSYTPAGSGRHRPHESAVRRQGRAGDRVELPIASPDARDGRPLPRAHHPPAQARAGAQPSSFPTGRSSVRA